MQIVKAVTYITYEYWQSWEFLRMWVTVAWFEEQTLLGIPERC